MNNETVNSTAAADEAIVEQTEKLSADAENNHASDAQAEAPLYIIQTCRHPETGELVTGGGDDNVSR